MQPRQVGIAVHVARLASGDLEQAGGLREPARAQARRAWRGLVTPGWFSVHGRLRHLPRALKRRQNRRGDIDAGHPRQRAPAGNRVDLEHDETARGRDRESGRRPPSRPRSRGPRPAPAARPRARARTARRGRPATRLCANRTPRRMPAHHADAPRPRSTNTR